MLTDLSFWGLDCMILENEHLQIVVLDGKGGDILSFQDKRTDVGVL